MALKPDFPHFLRCCGYQSRRRRRWVGYCLDLNLRTEGGTMEELHEKLVLSATLRLAELERSAASPLPRPSFKRWLCYAYIACLHLLRPRPRRWLTDLPTRVLLPQN